MAALLERCEPSWKTDLVGKPSVALAWVARAFVVANKHAEPQASFRDQTPKSAIRTGLGDADGGKEEAVGGGSASTGLRGADGGKETVGGEKEAADCRTYFINR